MHGNTKTTQICAPDKHRNWTKCTLLVVAFDVTTLPADCYASTEGKLSESSSMPNWDICMKAQLTFCHNLLLVWSQLEISSHISLLDNRTFPALSAEPHIWNITCDDREASQDDQLDHHIQNIWFFCNNSIHSTMRWYEKSTCSTIHNALLDKVINFSLTVNNGLQYWWIFDMTLNYNFAN